MLPCWPTAAVTLAEDEEGGLVLVEGLVLCDAALDVAKVCFGSVRLGGRHVADDLAVVESDPVEGGVREGVDVVPAQLLGQEACHAGDAADLGQLSRVAERVWEPEGLAALPKLALKISLSIQELPDERLATGQVGIVFDPASSNGLEASLLDLLLDTVEGGRVVLLEPLVLLCL